MTVFYAVHRGRSTGVFTSWGECKEAIQDYTGASYRKFETREEAEAFVERGPTRPAAAPAASVATEGERSDGGGAGSAPARTIPFGKYRGASVADVILRDRRYLEWLAGEMEKSGKTTDPVFLAIQSALNADK